MRSSGSSSRASSSAIVPVTRSVSRPTGGCTSSTRRGCLTFPHFATRILFQVDTKDAVLSLDGGLTDHLFLGNLKGQMLLDGLAIEGGATISAKNAVGGQNYANLTVAVW